MKAFIALPIAILLVVAVSAAKYDLKSYTHYSERNLQTQPSLEKSNAALP